MDASGLFDSLFVRWPAPVGQIDHARIVGDLQSGIKVEDHAVDFPARSRGEVDDAPRRFLRGWSGCECPRGNRDGRTAPGSDRSLGVSTQPGAIMLHVIAIREIFDGHLLGQTPEAGLAHDIRKQTRHGPRRPRGADVNDRAPARAQVGNGRLDAQPRALEIDGQRSIPQRLVGRFHGPARTDTRAVHQQIEPSPSRVRAMTPRVPSRRARLTSRCSPTTSNPSFCNSAAACCRAIRLRYRQAQPCMRPRRAIGRFPGRYPGHAPVTSAIVRSPAPIDTHSLNLPVVARSHIALGEMSSERNAVIKKP